MLLRAEQCEVERERRYGRWSIAVGAAICVGLAGGMVSPAWAAGPAADPGEVQLGSFSLGDSLEATVGELDGSFGFTIAAGGLQLGWDSRAGASDRFRLGKGWSFGLARVEVAGGVWVHPVSGGSFPMSASVPSGLAGYEGGDVVFAKAEPGAVVPARADGTVGETPYAYVLHELGGSATYFDAAGYPVAKLVEGGDRLDWTWEAGSGRLLAVVTAEGSVTSLDWSDPSRLVITPGSNVTDPVEGSGAGGQWEVSLEGGRLSEVAFPGGGVTRVGYDRAGLVERVSTPSGSSTAVTWQPSTDGVARVARVRLVDDASGAVLSEREWGVQGEVAPSGWPLVGDAVSSFGVAGAPGGGETPGYQAWLSDGKSRVQSTVDGHQRLTSRSIAVTTGSGQHLLQEHEYEYPKQDELTGEPAVSTKPTSMTLTHHDLQGGSRSVGESFVFDGFGRMVERRAGDGSVVRRVFDGVVGVGGVLPVGLVVEETTVGGDGLVSQVRSELSGDRSAVVASEVWSGRVGGELVRTARVESDVVGGFVSERRVFPGGDVGAVPVVTRWSEVVDVSRGVRSVVESRAVGSPVEVSVSSLVHGGVLSATDEVGRVSSASFDGAGRRVSVVDGAGRSVGYSYRSVQVDGVNEVSVAAGSGVVVTETRDVLGRVVRRADNVAPSGRVEVGFERVFESVEYPGPGVERVRDAWGAVTTSERDVYGRERRVELPTGVVQVAKYDDVAGSATSGVSVSGELADAEVTSTTTRDPEARRVTTSGVRADGVVVPEASTAYDGLGRVVSSSDGTRVTSTEYDVSGDPVSTGLVAAEGAEAVVGAGSVVGAEVTAERRFDGFGVSLEKTVRAGDEVSAGKQRVLDELGRVVSETDQGGLTERYSYTPDGLVAEVVSESGRVRSNVYDEVTRELIGSRVSSPGGATVETAYRYEDGQLVAVFDPADEAGTTLSYEWDAFGNRTRTVYPDGREVRHEFDANGRKLATVDVDGNRSSFSYDEVDGSLLGVVQVDRDGAPLGGVSYGYDELSRVESVARDNGVRTEYTFTSASQVASEVTTGAGGVVSEREYEYAPNGTLTSRVDRVLGASGEFEVSRTEYEYDVHGQLLVSSVRAGDGADARVVTRTEYVPTVGGDLASETVISDPGTADEVRVTRRFEYSPVGELVGIVAGEVRGAQRFDADGSLVESAAGVRFEYDAAARPVAKTVGGVRVETGYWADGSRRVQSDGAGSTRFYWDGAQLVNEVHERGEEDAVAGYLIGADRQARTVRVDGGASSTAYYGTDRHGNVTELFDQDGAVQSWYRYSDYGSVQVAGEQASVAGVVGQVRYNPFQYAGEYTYADGTQALGVRTYDPVQARFFTEDIEPLKNLYAYGNLNPITNIDPTGRNSVLDWARIGSLAGGFLFAVAGAALFVMSAISTGGIGGLGVLGLVSGLVAGGDATVAGFEVAAELGKVQWADKEAIAAASWTFAAVSVALGLAGGLAKYATRHGAKTVTRLDPETELRYLNDDIKWRLDTVSEIEARDLRTAKRMLDDVQVTESVDGAITQLNRLQRNQTDYAELLELAKTGNKEEVLDLTRALDAESTKWAARLEDELALARARVEQINRASMTPEMPEGQWVASVKKMSSAHNTARRAVGLDEIHVKSKSTEVDTSDAEY